MVAMDPFEQLPSGAPASLNPPIGGGHGGNSSHDGPRRGRMALAALAAAGLVGGGVVVAGQFASADDRPSLEAGEAAAEPTPDAPPERVVPVERSGSAATDGEIVLDLGALGECLGPIFGGGPLFGTDAEGAPGSPFDDDFAQRMEEFLDGLPWDELGDLDLDLDGLDLDDGVRIFGSGGSMITVVGPGGVELIDLGEGDATVTIEQTDGELTIETDGDVTVSDLPDLGELFSEFGELDLDELDLGALGLGELGDWQSLDELPGLDDIRSCLEG